MSALARVVWINRAFCSSTEFTHNSASAGVLANWMWRWMRRGMRRSLSCSQYQISLHWFRTCCHPGGSSRR
jgi:hypothetical protein